MMCCGCVRRWEHTFTHEDEEAYFAWCYPHSYADCVAKLDSIEESLAAAASAAAMGPPKRNEPIYFKREVVTHSLEGYVRTAHEYELFEHAPSSVPAEMWYWLLGTVG